MSMHLAAVPPQVGVDLWCQPYDIQFLPPRLKLLDYFIFNLSLIVVPYLKQELLPVLSKELLSVKD